MGNHISKLPGKRALPKVLFPYYLFYYRNLQNFQRCIAAITAQCACHLIWRDHSFFFFLASCLSGGSLYRLCSHCQQQRQLMLPATAITRTDACMAPVLAGGACRWQSYILLGRGYLRVSCSHHQLNGIAHEHFAATYELLACRTY